MDGPRRRAGPAPCTSTSRPSAWCCAGSRPTDLDDLVALDGDPAVMRYITGGAPTPRDEMRDDYLPFWLAYYDARRPVRLLGGDRAGDRRLPRLVPPATAPRGPGGRARARLPARARRSWGLGYATEGSRALIDKAFAELGARRVHASTMAVNTGSRRVMEKAGMRFVRTFVMDWPVRIEGDEDGDVEYAIDRAEWEADRSAAGSA